MAATAPCCLAFLVAILFSSACESTRERGVVGGVIVRDSAGVEIVTNSQAEQLLRLQRVLSLGAVEGDPNYLFARIRAIVLESDNGIWVVDGHPSIRHYDSTGVYVGRVGAAGRGPGEAQGYAGAWVANDKVLAWGNPSIIQLFTREGALLGSRPAITEGRTLILPIGYARDRWFFLLQQYRLDRVEEFRRTFYVAASRQLTGRADTIHSFPGELRRRLPNGEVGRSSYFHGNSSYAVDLDGRLFLSDTLDYRIAVFDARGTLERLILRPVSAPAFDPAWIPEVEEAVTAALRGDNNNPVNQSERDRLVASIVPRQPPAHLPIIRRLLVARTGEMWIERADRHPRPAMRAVAHAFGYVRHAWRPEWVAPQVFDVFTASGVYRGTVEIPANYEPMAVSSDRVYGVFYDDLGVEYVTAYQLAATSD